MATLERKHVSKWVPTDKTTLMIVLLFTTVVNSCTLGYDSSMMSGLNILPQYKDYFHLNSKTQGLLTAGSWMGHILATPFIQYIPDKYGRKATITVSAFFCVIASIITTAAHNPATFILGRIITGFGSQISSGGAPTLVGEIVKPGRRGFILGLFFSCYYVGSLISASVNLGAVDIASTWAWRLPAILQCVPSVLSLCFLPFVPESPRWLIANGKSEEARETLAIVYGQTDVDGLETSAIYTEIRSAIMYEKETYPRNPWKEITTGKPNLHRLFICVSFGIMLETVGNFVASFYLGDMLTLAGITNSTTQLQINVILSCWCFVVAVVGSYLLDIIGRRPQMLWSVLSMAVCLFAIGAMTKAYGTSTNTSGIYGTIAFIFIFQGLYSVSVTPLTTVYAPEIMHYSIRTAGISVFRLFDCIAGLSYSFAMPYAMESLGWKFFMVNAVINIFFFVVVWFSWVETKGIPLEEIAIKFGEPDPRSIEVIDGEVAGDDDDKRSVTVKVKQQI
ncbi:hypothetical protein EG328_001100 [Venturia inaequalis]|uniref:Major facilitator superfamily (MFS) profile domain-containing protein n=1 Tax=Venturia inaequalis TaxID=5025 RepID=A0A8H3V1J1_VENIN|nr:hypothetical protein EG328_001100 [Venturia inaequalis]